MTLPLPGSTHAFACRRARRARATGPGRALIVCLSALLGLSGCISHGTRVESGPGQPSGVPDAARANDDTARAGTGGARAQRTEVERRPAPAPEPEDVWARIQSQVSIHVEDRPRTRAEIDWLRRNQNYLDRVAARARYYLPYVVSEIERREMPLELAMLPVVESAFQPFATSPAGASGLWQFMPSTARAYGVRQSWWYDGRRDVVDSTRAALDYLARLHAEFDGDWLLAVAAYNSGQGNVRKAIRRNRQAGKPTDFWSLRLPRETRAYVPRLLAHIAVVADPAAYGLELIPIAYEPYFEAVAVDSQIDLALAAESAGVTLDEIYLLNPGYNRWATDPAGPHRLLVPVDAAARFRTRLAALPAEQRVQWKRHRVASGDTLGSLAEKYETSVVAIRQANDLDGHAITAGGDLMVPVAARSPESYRVSANMERIIGRQPPAGSRTTHVVRNGESLWLIARRHDVRVKQIVAWNGISKNTVIRPGQKLVIWGETPASRPRAPRTEVARANAPRPGAGLYTVRRGDNLWLIARRHRVSVGDLADWNRLARRTTLQPGQTLRVSAVAGGSPVTTDVASTTREHVRYTVRRGDSLWEIARRFGVSVSALREWNGLTPGGHLQPGQELSVYLGRSPASRQS